MMRYYAFLVLLLAFKIAYTQKELKEYYGKDGRKSEEANSHYYLIGKSIDVYDPINGVRQIYIDTIKTFYTSTNGIRSMIVYDSGYLNGSYEFYYNNGGTSEKGTYLRSQRIDTLKYWYSNGILRLTLYYPTKEERKKLPPAEFKIVQYSDSIGNQFVKNGNGYCKCYLFGNANPMEGIMEEGKVMNSFRDSIWHGFQNGNRLFIEHYDEGKFIEGTNFSGVTPHKYTEFEEPPEYVGGQSAMQKKITRNVKYPKEALRNRIQGTVHVSFIVRWDGSVTDHTVIQSIGGGCDEEALRAVKQLTNWKPGRQRGIPVNVKFVYPVKFQL